MKFSYEKLYFMYGQFDRLVLISFFQDTEAASLLPNYFMGSLKYSHEEIKELEKRKEKFSKNRKKSKVYSI